MCPLTIDCLPLSFRPVPEKWPSSLESHPGSRRTAGCAKVVDCFFGSARSLMKFIDLRRRRGVCSSAEMIALISRLRISRNYLAWNPTVSVINGHLTICLG